LKKAFAIFLVSLYIFSFTETRELLKLPAFIEHYKEHKAENKTTLLGFITLHYLNGSQKDADYAKDMKLPFKTHDFSCYNLAIQDLPKIFEFNIPLLKHFKEIKRNYYYAFHFSSFSEFFHSTSEFI
jgi:hypothetical protein